MTYENECNRIGHHLIGDGQVRVECVRCDFVWTKPERKCQQCGATEGLHFRDPRCASTMMCNERYLSRTAR